MTVNRTGHPHKCEKKRKEMTQSFSFDEGARYTNIKQKRQEKIAM